MIYFFIFDYHGLKTTPRLPVLILYYSLRNVRMYEIRIFIYIYIYIHIFI